MKGSFTKEVIFLEDSKIVQLYWDRDQSAIPATSEKYGSYCTSIARNILGSHEDAEECVNDTYLKAWNSMPPHKPSFLSAFLGKITRNLSFDRFSYNKAEKRGGGEIVLVLEELAECVSDTDCVEQAVNSRELTRAIEDFLGTLSPEKRGIFVSRYWYTESVTSIARRLGMKEGAVSMTLNRLLQKLRGHLEERGFEL